MRVEASIKYNDNYILAYYQQLNTISTKININVET